MLLHSCESISTRLEGTTSTSAECDQISIDHRPRFRRLAARRGKKRATIAVAHTILRIIYHMLREGIHFHDLGPAYFDRLNPERIKHYLVSRLERLGFKVMLEPQQATA